MPKAIPDCPGEMPKGVRGTEERAYRIELVTPLFGGGVEAGENDPTMPVRCTAIRGQLQFWWRATRGAACASLEELRARHREVWGATECASPVVVEVAEVQASEPVPCAEYRWDAQAGRGRGGWRLRWLEPFHGRDSALPYVWFPFQGTQPAADPRAEPVERPARCIHRASFLLRLRFPARLRPDVEAAVWAWVNFGGLGARTRRGCGALYCKELAPAGLQGLGDWFRLRAGGSPGERRDWPTLGGRLLYRRTTSNGFDAWNHVVGLMRLFRQGRDVGRNPGESELRPGRSRFPEPETIRRILDTGSAAHEPWPWMPDGFPRAELGLPIVFHFKDERDGEPGQTCLYPYVGEETKDRMASPLILKPLALQDRSAVSVIVPLLGPEVSRVELQDEGKNCRTPRRAVPVRSTAFVEQTYQNSPFRGRSQVGSALEAFLAFVRENPRSFLEVTR
jgi:CRISPR-associated protein Cmr1